MAVASMRKVFLVAHRDDRDAIAEVLQRLGVLQVEDILSLPELEEDIGILRDEPGAKASELDARLADLRFSLDFLNRLDPEKTTFIQQFTGTKVLLSEQKFTDYWSNQEKVNETVRALRKFDEQLNRIRNEETQKNNLLAALEPYLSLDVPLEELANGPDVAIEVGVLPQDNLTALKSALEEASPDAYVEELGGSREEAFVFILSDQTDQDTVQDILRRNAFSRATFPEREGTCAQVKTQLEQELAALTADKEQVLATARQYVDNRLLLKVTHDELSLQRSRLELALKFGRTEETFALTGWIEEKNFSRLHKAVRKVSPSAYLTGEEARDEDNPPVVLQNTRVVWPFEVVTELFGLPGPGDIDPTPYLAPFYFLFFGMMYGDTAYGLILAGICWYLMKKIRMAGMAKKLFTTLMLGGFSAAIFGIITGSYFGSLPIPPIWFSPMDDPLKMLIVAMAVGMVQIYAGLTISMIQQIKKGHLVDGLFDQGLWMVFLTGLIMLLGESAMPALGPAARVLSWTGAIGLVATQGRNNKGLIKRLLSGIISLYDVSGYLSDVLSYSRLLALGLSTSVIGMVINNMVSMAAEGGGVGIALAALIFIGGHGFNLLINVIGAYVHASRLQYVEFFSKFYESGGRGFTPFGITTTYIELELEEREA
ncbi:MAG: V-type ATP synthase subunit I [bacterium]|jgi:V/A-type H+-transporting ATPase subunit I